MNAADTLVWDLRHMDASEASVSRLCSSAAHSVIPVDAGTQRFTAVYCWGQASSLYERRYQVVEEDWRHASVRRRLQLRERVGESKTTAARAERWRCPHRPTALNSDPDCWMLWVWRSFFILMIWTCDSMPKKTLIKTLGLQLSWNSLCFCPHLCIIMNVKA